MLLHSQHLTHNGAKSLIRRIVSVGRRFLWRAVSFRCDKLLLLQQICSLVPLKGFHDLGDILRPLTRANEQSVGRFHDD